MKKKETVNRAFYPSHPEDRMRSEQEAAEWRANLEEEKRLKKRDNIRFWITTILSGIAAVAAVAGVLIQLVLMQ